jgi:hypothetical protein
MFREKNRVEKEDGEELKKKLEKHVTIVAS